MAKVGKKYLMNIFKNLVCNTLFLFTQSFLTILCRNENIFIEIVSKVRISLGQT